jgi:hypothetical protein
MATEQELREQYELNQKKLGLTQGQIEEGLRLGQAKVGLSQQQLEQSYRLAQQQIQEQELEKQGQSSKLAQQAYISKAQNERVLPNVLSAMGVADTGYRNVRRQQIGQAYQGQQGAIHSDLQSAMANYGRQRSSQSLDYQQNLQGLDFTRQQLQSDYQQQLKSLELQRESASLDYRQALQRLQEQNAKSSGGGGNGGGSTSGSYNNSLLIYQYGAGGVENGMSPSEIGAYTKQYLDDGYINQADKNKLDTQLKNYAYTFNTGISQDSVNQALSQVKNPPKITPPPTKPKAQAPASQKLKKALAIGAW